MKATELKNGEIYVCKEYLFEVKYVVDSRVETNGFIDMNSSQFHPIGFFSDFTNIYSIATPSQVELFLLSLQHRHYTVPEKLNL